jgi:hypothetical protein
MRISTFLLTVIGVLLCLPLSPSALADTLHVDISVPASGDGTSWELAFKTIQEAIDTASRGDTVLVAEGTYVENIRFDGKEITLAGTDPLDSRVVENTIIDGSQSGPVVMFSGSESEECVLSGFTIRNGSAYEGGGIAGDGTHATIENNVITENLGEYQGGGLSDCGGEIRNNTITGNSAHGGAGLYACSGTIRENMIARNLADYEGGGLSDCGGEIRNNTITGNSAHGGGGLYDCDGLIQGNTITRNLADYRGGGLDGCDGTIRNNAVTENLSGYEGGGLYECAGTIENNTIARNLADYAGGGLAYCDGTIINCIIWENLAPSGPQVFESATPSYSCVQDWQGGGVGNMSDEPRFVNSGAEDYHLWSWSPGVDAGDPSSDFSQEPQPNGGRINMGAYGNTPKAATTSRNSDKDRLPDDWEMYFFGDLDQGPTDDPDGDGRSNFEEYQEGTNPAWSGWWYVDGSVTASGTGKSWGSAFKTIQEGIDASFHGDRVVVAPGNYVENIRFQGKNIALTSTDPLDTGVVAGTIIDGGQFASVVIFLGIEEDTCVLTGFTIRNGQAEEGGGIAGHGTHATIENNVITGNVAERYGGGLNDCDGTIRNNIIADNWQTDGHNGGGGLYDCDGTIENNTIADNLARQYGGGLYECNGTIRNCIIWGNRARTDPQLSRSENPTYSCIQGRQGGEGSTAAYPYFVDRRHGDYHLESWSPCIDAGDPISDFSIEPEPNGGRVNMGAYGNTRDAASASPDTDGDSLPDDWEMYIFGDLSRGKTSNPDNDNLSNGEEYFAGTDPLGLNYRIWHVDNSVFTSGSGASWENAFKTIQEGIDASSHGDIVLVAEGTYVENVHFKGKNIRLTSTNPLDPSVVDNTIIDGNQSGSVVTLFATENETCVLSGFTIRNGRGICGGGIVGGIGHWTGHLNTYATIEYNVIVGNTAPGDHEGGGAGGGIYGCDGILRNNVITDNWLSEPGMIGGGLCDCDGLIQNNIITGNSATFGGGLSWCDGIIQNNLIAENFTVHYGHGGGLYRCNAIVRNNTIVENSANWGGGLDFCEGSVLNCIIWGNTATLGPQMNRSSAPTYSCIQNWTEGGEGNIGQNPGFVDSGGHDYRLASGSSCIDRGKNEDWMWQAVDLDNRSRIGGSTVDMGAYEFGVFGPWYVDCSVSISGDGRSWPTAFKTIQEGVNAAEEDDEIIVAPCIYRENLVFKGVNVFLHSIDPEDPEVVASTIIDGGQKGCVITFEGSETPECLLLGFTLRNGLADCGGGICGGSQDARTRATVRHCMILNSRAAYDGGGIAFCDGLIENNLIRGNEAGDHGGGVHDCQGILRNNTIEGNTAFYSGGGVHWCHGLIQNNVVHGNSAGRGGGLDECGGVIQYNTITENWANLGGGGLAWCEGTVQGNAIRSNSAFYGGGLAWGKGTIQSNLIVGNVGVDRGGGLERCDGPIRNNTIVANSASDRGGGLADCRGTITNCVIWGNTANRSAHLSACTGPTYCCIEEQIEGEGNFTPPSAGFVDADGPDDDPDTLENNDYRLTDASPCIDVGKNESPLWHSLDMDGNARICHGIFSMTVDVGAYEYGASPVRILEIARSGEGIKLFWKSSPGENYVVWSCEDLLNGVWVREVKKELPSSGELTTWIDTTSALTCKFYKIEIKQ